VAAPEDFALLAEVPGLAHGVTTRAGGVSEGPYASLNLGLTTGDPGDAVAENRRRVARALDFGSLLLPHQVHGDAVLQVHTPLDAVGRCDALSTDQPGVLLGVLGADCPGVLLVHPQRRALAVVHAGWRGVEAGIVPKVVRHLRAAYGSPPEALLAVIGPGISGHRYEVSDDVATRIAGAVPHDGERALRVPGRPGHAHVDLVEAIHRQLRGSDVAAERIARHGVCTYDDHRFFSHRRDAGRTGRHALLAGWHAVDC